MGWCLYTSSQWQRGGDTGWLKPSTSHISHLWEILFLYRVRLGVPGKEEATLGCLLSTFGSVSFVSKFKESVKVLQVFLLIEQIAETPFIFWSHFSCLSSWVRQLVLDLALFDVSPCGLAHLLSLVTSHLGKFRMGTSLCAIQKSVCLYGQSKNTELMWSSCQ